MDAPPLLSRPVSSCLHWTIPAPPQHLLLYILSEAPRSHGRIIFKHDSFDDKLVGAATDEAQAAPKKPQTDLLWCEKEWGKECEKVLVKFTRILDDVSLHATEDSEE
jgi:hypothetical protein